MIGLCLRVALSCLFIKEIRGLIKPADTIASLWCSSEVENSKRFIFFFSTRVIFCLVLDVTTSLKVPNKIDIVLKLFLSKRFSYYTIINF